jgi:hypothetical protein
MRTHAKPPAGPEPTWQPSSRGRHARASPPPEQDFDHGPPPERDFDHGPPPEQDFDYGRPFLVDIGRAAVIAEALREFGYRTCTADVVVAELAMPQRERTIIGRFAADQLARAGWRP